MSIVDIARLAGVSPTTVSRVFSENAYVRPETRAHVLRIAKENNYQPRVYKKSVRVAANNTVVGIVVPDIENPFFLQIIRAISEVFDQHDIEILICDTNEEPNKEIRNLSLLEKLSVNGIIIAPTSENAEYNGAFVKEMHAKGTPIVVLDRDVKGIGLSGVFQNSYDASYTAILKLIENGHRHIAIIGGPLTSKPGLDRMLGYMDALKQHDIPVRQEYILYGDFKSQSGYALTKQILRERPEVTAVFAANNLMSIGALQAIFEKGLCIPQDIAFIAYGSLQPFHIHQTAITEVSEPTELMGYECAHLMLEKMSTSRKVQRAVKRVNFDTNFLLRGSEVYPVNRQ